jgi:ankyrin repeat protein
VPPLVRAALACEPAVIRTLLDHGADVNKPSLYRGSVPFTPLAAAASRSLDNVEIIQLLLDRGAQINPPEKSGHTPLDVAINAGQTEVVSLLLARGADPNADTRGFGGSLSPLAFAATYNHLEILRLLLDHGARINSESLWQALHYNQPKVASLLLDRGADPNLSDDRGGIPLLYVAESGSLDLARLLLDHRADVNASDGWGWAALHYATASGHQEMTSLLLARGAKISAKMKSDVPLRQNRMLSEIKGFQGGAEAWTPLHFAVARGDRAMVELLLQQGADVNVKDGGGLTPLQLAQKSQSKDIEQLLLAPR